MSGGDLAAPAPPAQVWRRGLHAVRATLAMIKFPHTAFALPFAFTGAFLAADGLPSLRVVAWIAGAMVGARTAAMVFNRIADRRYDRRNPRTAARPLASGELGLFPAWLALLLGAALLLVSAARLNPLAFLLAPAALAVILSYSYAKRLSWLTHLHLGLALGLAPIGGWVAVRGALDAAPLVLGAAVALWVAGFDILYACQDLEFDRRERLHSAPARFGIPAALRLSSALHAGAALLLMALTGILSLGPWYVAGVALASALLWYEHRVVHADDLSRLDQAFFTMNGCVSALVFAGTALDRLLR